MFLTDEEVKRVIEEAAKKSANETVLKLKLAGLVKDDGKNVFQKTEEILKNYNLFKLSDEPHTKKLLAKIEEAMKTIENDPYKEAIEMFYFDGVSREEVAEYYNTSVTTISRNKTRLINKIKIILFSDETILQIYS